MTDTGMGCFIPKLGSRLFRETVGLPLQAFVRNVAVPLQNLE